MTRHHARRLAQTQQVVQKRTPRQAQRRANTTAVETNVAAVVIAAEKTSNQT